MATLAAILAPFVPDTQSLGGVLARAGAMLHPEVSLAASAIPFLFHEVFAPAHATLALLAAGYRIALATFVGILHALPLYLRGM